MEEKQFCGSARVKETQYGPLTTLSFSRKDLDVLSKNLENGWVNAVVKEKRNTQEGKPTHYIEVDTWKPTQQAAVNNAGPLNGDMANQFNDEFNDNPF